MHTDIRRISYQAYIYVYCDGSCLGNGTDEARGGYAVYFSDPQLQHLTGAALLPGYEQTSSRAELHALIRGALNAPKDGRQVVLLTDSQYAIDTVARWLDKWKLNGWKNARGRSVANRDLIEELDECLSDHHPRPIFKHVKGHTGIEGNELVDRMAKVAAQDGCCRKCFEKRFLRRLLREANLN